MVHAGAHRVGIARSSGTRQRHNHSTAPEAELVAIPAECAPSRPQPAADEPLDAVCALLDELARRAVGYCLWKSNNHLDAALAGSTDLDVLVERADTAAFREVLASHALMATVPDRTIAHPALEHYLGLDRRTGRLFHLHVHYQLILGEKHVKNHRLPIERAVLRSTRTMSGVRVPAAELELAILVVRTLLKYRARDVVKDVLEIRHPGVPVETRREIEWLASQTDHDRLRRALEPVGAVIPVDVVCDFLVDLTKDHRPGFTLLRHRTRMRRALRDMQRRSPVRARVDYLIACWRSRKRRRARAAQPLKLATGGTTIAFVGADGAGKSTNAESVWQWLGWKLDTRRYYMGSKQPSLRSRALYLAFRALRRSHRSVVARSSGGSHLARLAASARDVALAGHYLSIGGDRSRRNGLALRAANQGSIVVFDRYPLEVLSSRPNHRLLDGPHVELVLGEPRSAATRALAALEKRTYRRFRLPDHLVVLEVDAGTAIERKPDHRFDVVAEKARAVAELAWQAELRDGVNVIRIDAGRDLDEVLFETRLGLWNAL